MRWSVQVHDASTKEDVLLDLEVEGDSAGDALMDAALDDRDYFDALNGVEGPVVVFVNPMQEGGE